MTNQNYIQVTVFPSNLEWIKEENYNLEFHLINVNTNEATLVDIVEHIGTLSNIRKKYIHKVDTDGLTYVLNFDNVKEDFTTMKTIYNECTSCGEKWQVIGSQSHLTWDDIHLDDTDKANLSKHNQLFSICEECSTSGECESVEKE